VGARSTDLLIVGAGPAGSAAAITARGQGRSVTMIDKATFPRDKCCGDGLTAEALRLLESLGVRPTEVEGWNQVSDVVVRAPSGREHRFPLPPDGQHGAVVPRLSLDAALVDVAKQAGTVVHEGAAVASIDQHGDRVVVSTGEGHEIHARYVVAADGMWSPSRKLLGVDDPGYLGEWHAFRQYFSDVGPRGQHLTVWFEADLLPGYAWAFPLPGRRANVGFGIHRGSRWSVADMKHLWPELLARPHVQEYLGGHARPDGPHRAWPIPARVASRRQALGRVLFAGDAAAATDPMTGEGIAQALFSGAAAARAISTAGVNRPAKAGATYEARLSAELAVDHRLAARLAALLATERHTERALRAAGATGWTRRNFARWMFEDYPRAILATPRRWHRGMLSPPGAYRDVEPAAASIAMRTVADHR
jgi:geranylgeranyl reductase family protein